MKKRFLVILLALAATLCLAFALAGCAPTPNGNTGNTTEQSGNSSNSGNSGNNSGSSSSTGNTNTPEGGNTGSTTEPETPNTGNTGNESSGGNTQHEHDFDTLIITPATCTTTGVEAHYHCACGKFFNKDKVEVSEQQLLTIPIDGNGHVLNKGESACANCGTHLTADLEYSLLNDNTYSVSWGTATDSNIIIPAIYDGKPVTSIRRFAFSYGDIESITLPNSITKIGDSAFKECRLKSINIPDSVISVGDSAFHACSSLTGVYITDLAAWCNIEYNYEANPLYYANNLYLNNKLVTEITAEMLQGVTKIKRYAFSGCTSLESITIPDSVTYIGDDAFYYCTKLKSINMSQNVTYIGGRAFNNCTSLTSITIPNSVTRIGNYAFDKCSSLTGVYITDLAAWCNIEVGSNPLYYAHNLYLDNEPVTDITAEMLQGVKEIKSGAFSGCTSIASITIPDSVTSIGSSAFAGCNSLENITVEENNTMYSSQDGILYNKEKTQFIHIPNAIKGAITIPDEVTSIGDFAFYHCTNLTSITIPDSVTSIGRSAFYECTSLESVTFVNRTGWKVRYLNSENWTDVNADDPAHNAELLTSTYKEYYWKREG